MLCNEGKYSIAYSSFEDYVYLFAIFSCVPWGDCHVLSQYFLAFSFCRTRQNLPNSKALVKTFRVLPELVGRRS